MSSQQNSANAEKATVSCLTNAIGTTGISTNNNVIDNVVTFNVGGRIFQIRRTLLDSYPDTMLARAASDLWKEKIEIISPTTTDCVKKPIFIDRDSTRFACVLDFMRDSCSIDLPVTVTKESFLRELQYFGFDMTTINSDCITYNIPAYEAIVKVDKLHKGFQIKTAQMQLAKDHTILAYICFSETAKDVSGRCVIEVKESRIILPQSVQQRIGSISIISDTSLFETVKSLDNLCKQFVRVTSVSSDATNNEKLSVKSAMKYVTAFNEHLAEYGLECTSMNKFEKCGKYGYSFQLKQAN
jgi:BTB/POZ domain